MLLGFCSYVMIWRHPADQANIDFLATCKTGLRVEQACRKAFLVVDWVELPIKQPVLILKSGGHQAVQELLGENWSFKLDYYFSNTKFYLAQFPFLTFFWGIKLEFGSLLPNSHGVLTPFILVLEIVVENLESSLICSEIWILGHFPRCIHGAQIRDYPKEKHLIYGTVI